MKTRETNFIKTIIMTTVLSLGLISCGGENKSGGGSSSSSSGNGTVILSSNNLNQLEQENPCIAGGSRIKRSIPMQNQAPKSNNQYVGVSSYGDIAVLSGREMVLHMCPRAYEGSAQVDHASLVFSDGDDNVCPFGQIVKLNIYLTPNGNGGGDIIKIGSAHIPGTQFQSNLCQGYNSGYNGGYNYGYNTNLYY